MRWRFWGMWAITYLAALSAQQEIGGWRGWAAAIGIFAVFFGVPALVSRFRDRSASSEDR